MISKNIKSLRLQKGYTQKELADKLFVTSQAVSRWEKGTVEPSISTVEQLAKVFGVTTDEIIGGPNKKPDVKKVTKYKNRYIVKEAEPVLGVCEMCNKPIYKTEEIVRDSGIRNGKYQLKVVCKNCVTNYANAIYKRDVESGVSQRKQSFIWGSIFAALLFVVGIIYLIFNPSPINIPFIIILPLVAFTFTSCMFLKNNFVRNMFLEIASWGFVKFPGIIFSFDLDGFIFLIVLKVLFWILGILIGLLGISFALFLCLPLSVIVYPFALKNNLKNPEKFDKI